MTLYKCQILVTLCDSKLKFPRALATTRFPTVASRLAEQRLCFHCTFSYQVQECHRTPSRKFRAPRQTFFRLSGVPQSLSLSPNSMRRRDKELQPPSFRETLLYIKYTTEGSSELRPKPHHSFTTVRYQLVTSSRNVSYTSFTSRCRIRSW